MDKLDIARGDAVCNDYCIGVLALTETKIVWQRHLPTLGLNDSLPFKYQGKNAMWFAAHLYKQGAITGEQFAKAVQIQLSCQLPLGALAIRAEMLSIGQVMEILRESARKPDKAFGGLAVELGLLVQSQVAELLLMQADEAPSMNEILVVVNRT